jgi:hypothetical protein
MKSIPIEIANELSDVGVAWRDVVQEIARATRRASLRTALPLAAGVIPTT